MLSTTSTVLASGWRWMARVIERVLLSQPATSIVLDAVDDGGDLAEPHRGARCDRRRSATDSRPPFQLARRLQA